MNSQIYPCLWFDGNGKEAADLYCSLFENSKVTTDSPMVVMFEIEGRKIMALNGGAMFIKNPSISLFVTCASDKEADRVWNKLSEGGKTLMPLDTYPWAEKYGWLEDKFGMSWQIMRAEITDPSQRIIPSLLFVGEQYGKAKAAVQKYTSIIPDSKVHELHLYEVGESQLEGKVKFGQFTLNKSLFAAMDGFGDHEYAFNEGVSLVIECDNQQEIDYFWQKLTEGGEESRCGWLKDEFGVSWQIVPKIMDKLMTDPEKGPRAMQALMKMKKLNIDLLENA